MAQEIEVIIAGDGKVELEVKGVRGKQCLHLTREIETGLGALINRKTKPEYGLNTVNLFSHKSRGYAGTRVFGHF